jgi:hypothetical protein
MLGNFFRRSTEQKERANKKQYLSTTFKEKQNVKIDNPASIGGQGNILGSLGLRLRQHCPFLTLLFP